MSLSLTLDTNCLIDLENHRPSAAAIRTLIDAHRRRIADVALVAISASENMRGNVKPSNFKDFQARLRRADAADLTIILPMAYLDITYINYCKLVDDNMLMLEFDIHSILFPNVRFRASEYRAASCNTIPANRPLTGKWLNCKCDVQAMWSHISEKRNIFVTSDRNFHKPKKKPALIGLGAGAIELPERAASLVCRQLAG